MKLRSILVDDENFNLDLLSNILRTNASDAIDIIATSNNFFDAVNKINSLKPDVLFLDIKLDRGTAFDLLNTIEDYSYLVVFVTGHDDFIINAFKYSTSYYILKPTTVKQVLEAVDSVTKQFAIKKFTKKEEIENLINQINYPKKNHFLKVFSEPKKEDTISHIRCDDILFLKAEKSHTHIYLKETEFLISTKCIEYYEFIISDGLFFRTHKNYLVNLNKVNTIIKSDGYYCELKGGCLVPLSKRNISLLHSKLNLNI